ncbi:hypothetical protein ACA910_005958 [Epithemia clementina (nom. ined.)]
MSSNTNKRASSEQQEDEDDANNPPSKRMRTTVTESSPSGTKIDGTITYFSSLDEGSVNLSKINDLVEKMLDQLQHIKKENADHTTGTTTSVSSSITSLNRGLLLLRTWQRGLLQRCSSLEEACQAQCESKRRQKQTWGSLQYEKSYLQQEIATVQNFSMPFLDQVLQGQRSQEQRNTARQEASLNQGEECASIQPSEQQQLLLDPNNPSHRTLILQYLQSQLQQRSSLEKERDRLKAKLKSVQRKCQQEQLALKQLPQHLATLEAATKPLQHWFDLPLIGTVRTERLQLAQELPTPLYTLFISLQQYIDLVDASTMSSSSSVETVAEATNQMETGSSGPSGKMSLRVVPTIGNAAEKQEEQRQQPHEVQWSLPVPDVAAAAAAASNNTNNQKMNRSVTIHFQCHLDEKEKKSSTISTKGPQIIKATASGCPTLLDQTWLLSSLFPNDSLSHDGGYYRWCHYLAGIHLVSAQTTPVSLAATTTAAAATTTTNSTRTIVQTLQRRIRANATLKYILQSLCQHHTIPNAPSNNKNEDNDATISRSLATWQISFTQQPQQQQHQSNLLDKPLSSRFTYNVHCKKSLARNNTLELRAAVEIDKAQYPSVPPVWTLFPDPPDSSTPAMYNATWDLLEKDVNQSLLSEKTNRASNVSAEVSPSEPANQVVTMADATTTKSEALDESEESLLFAEWVLVHQLNRLLDKWEQVATTSSSSLSSSGMRAVRGRDRVPVSLFETNNQLSSL